MAKLSNNDLTLKVGFDIDKFTSELQKTTGVLNKWSTGLQSSIVGLGAAFTALSVGKFALDVSKLAGEAEGVKLAFDKLPGSVQLMNDLKKATSGTVSELELMKRSVMASNFDISLKALPNLLEFAAVRAKQTGQSVDYLVDSIVTGIGRKSKLILDNLGISAVQLTEALGGASTASSTIGEVADAVGKIAAEALERSGRMAETNATKLERLAASWTNVQVEIGKTANGTGILGTALDGLITRMDTFSSDNLSFWQKVALLAGGTTEMQKKAIKASDLIASNAELKKQKEVLEATNWVIRAYGLNLDKIKEGLDNDVWGWDVAINKQGILNEITKRVIELDKKKAEQIENETNLKSKLALLEADALTLTGAKRAAINVEIDGINKKIKALQSLGTEQDKQKAQQFKSLNGWQSQSAMPSAMGERVAKPELSNVGKWLSGLQGVTKALQDKAMAEDEAAAAAANHAEKMTNLLNTSIQVADVFGESLGYMMSGVQSFAESMKSMAQRIVTELFRIAEMAIITKNVLALGPGGLIAASAGLAALRGLVGGILSKGGSGGGGSYTGTSQTQQYYNPRRSDAQVVTFRVQGADLIGVLRNANYKTGKLGG